MPEAQRADVQLVLTGTILGQ